MHVERNCCTSSTCVVGSVVVCVLCGSQSQWYTGAQLSVSPQWSVCVWKNSAVNMFSHSIFGM